MPRTGAVGTWRCIVTATPTILSMYWICGNFTVFCVSESRAPALRHNGLCPPLRSRTALEHLNQSSGSPGGHCLCTAGCRASPRHELRLRHLVSFRDIRPLSLYHSVYDLNCLRDLLDGRHLFLYCRFISLNCNCVVSTAFWMKWTCGICAVFSILSIDIDHFDSVLQLVNLDDLRNPLTVESRWSSESV